MASQQNLLDAIVYRLTHTLQVEPHIALPVGIVAVFLLASIITGICIRINHVVFTRLPKKAELHYRFLRSLLDFLLVIGGIMLMGVFVGIGRSLSRILLGSTGLLMVIIGFAAQSALGDVIAGMMIGISRPFRLGDRITLEESGISGTVQDMTIRHTVLHQFDGLYVLVPNSVLSKEIIHNDTYKGELTASYLEFDISYSSDIQKAIKIIHDAVIGNRYAVEYAGDNPEKRAASVYVTGFMESSVRLRTTVWSRNADENFLALSGIRRRVKADFEREGIEIPYNYVNVLLHEEDEGGEETEASGRAAGQKVVVKPDEEENAAMLDVFRQVDGFCRRHRVSKRETVYIRMLSEELVTIMKNQTGSFEGDFSLGLKNSVCEIRLVSPLLDLHSRRDLLSSFGSVSFGSRMMDMLRSIFEEYREGKRTGSTPWSMRNFEKEQKAASASAPDPLADLEKSIIETLADDVQISANGGKVEMVVYRKLWSVAE